jgi:signal transduction histidine kinase
MAYIPRAVSIRDAEDQIFQRNIENLRNWSLISVIALALASGVGGYVLSGILLRPVRDITEVASEITASNLKRRINHQGPDDELKALANTFDSMVDRLERSFEQQRLFVQDASHELRTPLAAIRTNIEVAEMDPDLSAEDYQALLDTVKTQTERLTRLTEDLLLLSTNEGEQPEREPVVLGGLATEVVGQLAPLAAQRSVTLQVRGDDRLAALANADLLYRCVFNLVDNAIKYAGDGSTVTLTASRAGNLAEVAVSDNGAGIPADRLQHVFDRFYRVDRGRARREGGSGLGLAIVKELVTAMHGTVGVESSVGVGTRFWIRLEPAPDEPDADSLPQSIGTASFARARG